MHFAAQLLNEENTVIENSDLTSCVAEVNGIFTDVCNKI